MISVEDVSGISFFVYSVSCVFEMFRITRGLAVVVLLLLMSACAMHFSNSGDQPVPSRTSNSLRVASYNVHYIVLSRKTGAWSVGDWERRKAPLSDAVAALDADIIAFQEMESFSRGSDGSVNLTLDYLLDQHPKYAAAAVGEWQSFPSTQPIFYRKDKLQLLDQGWFFFSETPEEIYSRTFNGSYPAFCSWATFSSGTGEIFTVFNVHLEFKSASNRRLSSELVKSRLAQFIDRGQTVILAGDINEREGGRSLNILESGGLSFQAAKGATYHFNRGFNLFGAIDHIGTTPGFSVLNKPYVLRQKFRGEWPSDHYPVIVDLVADADSNSTDQPD